MKSDKSIKNGVRAQGIKRVMHEKRQSNQIEVDRMTWHVGLLSSTEDEWNFYFETRRPANLPSVAWSSRASSAGMSAIDYRRRCSSSPGGIGGAPSLIRLEWRPIGVIFECDTHKTSRLKQHTRVKSSSFQLTARWKPSFHAPRDVLSCANQTTTEITNR